MDLEGLKRVDPGFKRGPSGLSFSKTEIAHITIAVIVLSIAFAIMMYSDSYLDANKTLNFLKLLIISVLLVTCSFLVHELGHKYVAQSYGAWSEFRMYPLGLMMALVFSFFGFLFAAPGAVYIQGNISKEQNGKISMAGPMMNFIISAVAIVAMLMTTGLTSQILLQLAWLNAFLGIFNMIPIFPFDGSKIFAWKWQVFLIMVIIGAAEMIFLII
ncbi:MAG: site-2 protease family protein [Candidatus Methanogranum gryphiswaldense]|nr:MAG: site-2 protease family protein [Candidatus Methanogranum sp. U3.2.1]